MLENHAHAHAHAYVVEWQLENPENLVNYFYFTKTEDNKENPSEE